MFKSIKLVVLILATISSFQILSSEDKHPGHPPRTQLIEGIVHYGQNFTCEIWNDDHRPMRVINYTYNIWFRDPYGRSRLATRAFDCRYNCRVPANGYNVLSGPLNNGPTISASCTALVRSAR